MNIRTVTAADALTLRTLAEESKSLDVHTPYTYWVVCDLFGEECFLLEEDGQYAGYIMTVKNEGKLLVWQIGILEKYRGKGYSQVLYNAVFEYAKTHDIKKVYLSIDPSNENSYQAIRSFCERQNLTLVQNGNVHLHVPKEDFFEHELTYEIEL